MSKPDLHCSLEFIFKIFLFLCSFSDLAIKRIRIKVQKGQLHEAQAEVLVNTVDWSLDLTKDLISSSLLDKAGIGLQRELQQYQRKAVFGDVLKTGPGTLPKPCMVIFHGVLYAYGIQLSYDAK
ncbi:hypothetical protein ACJMK2_006867, partial [Sinanodonta woodiana]